MIRRGGKGDREYGFGEGSSLVFAHPGWYIMPKTHYGNLSFDQSQPNSNGGTVDSPHVYGPGRRPPASDFENQGPGLLSERLSVNAAPGCYQPR